MAGVIEGETVACLGAAEAAGALLALVERDVAAPAPPQMIGCAEAGQAGPEDDNH